MPLQINFCFDLFHNKKNGYWNSFLKQYLRLFKLNIKILNFFFHIWFFSCNHRVSSIFCIVILHKTSRHLIIPPYYIFHYTMGQNLLWSRIRICQTYLWVCYMMSQEIFLFTFSLGQSKSVWKIIVKLWIHKKFKCDFKIILAPLCIASQIANL